MRKPFLAKENYPGQGRVEMRQPNDKNLKKGEASKVVELIVTYEQE